jgi:hypothetical protein
VRSVKVKLRPPENETGAKSPAKESVANERKIEKSEILKSVLWLKAYLPKSDFKPYSYKIILEPFCYGKSIPLTIENVRALCYTDLNSNNF